MRTVHAALAAGLLALSTAASAAAPPSAEIVSVDGKGEFREARESAWRGAAPKQALFPTNFVRTLDMSRMAILFADRTQVRLSQNSVLQIKEVAAPGSDARTILQLNSGRSWTQSKSASNGLVMETPSALAAIRGTDWEMAVDGEGRATLSVFSGEVEFYNDQGRVMVNANEQARAEKGKAPVKLRLQVSRERVQWVSSFTIDERRHPGETLAAAYERLRRAAARDADGELLLADMEIYRGELAAAREVLRAAAARFPGDARFDVAQARVALLADEIAAARGHAQAALARRPDSVDALVMLGEVERRDGRATEALAAFARATSVAARDARGWHGLGVVEAERENVRRARSSLLRAIALDPSEADSPGELGTLEGFAGDYARAREALGKALALQPDNYVALTGLGVVELKAGNLEAATDALLRATLIEPRYARAHLYLAAAYYQMERDSAALSELDRASEMDPRDPLPYLLSSIIRLDRIEPGLAAEEARQALQRIPFLKSLNQVADNQKGIANVGYPLGFMGLEAWARSAAHDSYLPLWGGSHLFLADRYPGAFDKRSELLQGFITNPLVFGASNRYQSLFLEPGHHGTLSMRAAQSDDVRLYEPVLTLNGYTHRGAHLAYFAEASDTRVEPANTDLRLKGRTYTAAVGMKPTHETSFFLYANRLDLDAEIGRQGVTGVFDRIVGKADRVDAGALFAPDARSSFWLKAGASRQDSSVDELASVFVEDQAIFRGLHFDFEPKAHDVGARHTMLWSDRVELTWGAEGARTGSDKRLVQDESFFFAGFPVGTQELDQADQDRSETVHASARIGDERLRLEAGAAWTRYRSNRQLDFRVSSGASRMEESLVRRKVQPLLGVTWRVAPALAVRAACRRWLRPASLDTLMPVAVAGMPLDDQVTFGGGISDHCRVEGHWTPTPTSFVSVQAERQEIENLVSPLTGSVLNTGTDITNLERLRNRALTQPPKPDLLEDVPAFSAGRLTRGSLAYERIIASRVGLRVHYTYTDTRNTGLFAGNRIPYIGRHHGNLGLTIAPGWRSFLTLVAFYRSQRFTDEANTVALPAGWDVQGTFFIESADKRWALELYAANLLKKEVSDAFGAVLSYRF